MIFILDTPIKSFIGRLGERANTQPEYTVHYYDSEISEIDEQSTDGEFNGTTNVTMVSPPVEDESRIIKEITLYNADNITHNFVLILKVGDTERIIWKGHIGSLQTLILSQASDLSYEGTIVTDETIEGEGLPDDPYRVAAFIMVDLHQQNTDTMLAEGTDNEVTAQEIREIIDNPLVNTDEKVKYNADDPTAGYLADKIVAGDGISITQGTGDNVNKVLVTNTDKGSDVDISDKVDKEEGKGLSTEDYTTEEKNKLSGVAEGANNYTHPATHAPSIIEQDADNRFVTDSEKSTWNGKQSAIQHFEEAQSGIKNQWKAKGAGTDYDVELVPKGTGVIRASSKLIKDVATPLEDQDAATKKYVDDNTTPTDFETTNLECYGIVLEEGDYRAQLRNGRIGNDNIVTTVIGGKITISDDATNYIEVTTGGGLTTNTTGFTEGNIPLYEITLDEGALVGTLTTSDKRTRLRAKPIKFKKAYFNSEYDNGNSGAYITIDWNNGQNQKLTITENTSLTFTDIETGTYRVQVTLYQSGTGGFDVTLPANCVLLQDFTFTDGATGQFSILTLYFNGTFYSAAASKWNNTPIIP